MQAAASDVADRKLRVPWHFAFDGRVPRPRFGILEILCSALSRREEPRCAPVPPGSSTFPNETLAFGWNGGLPPRKTESLTPSRV